MKFAHLADIQIRAHSRHSEYRESFRRLYSSLRKQRPDRIVLAGDIVHNKTNISPELVDVLSDFLRTLAAIAPTDIILGNHDLSVKNPSRLDALQPVVTALNNYRINLMRESGLYNIGDGFMYVVMSILDEPSVWERLRADAKNLKETTIALWHGTISGVRLDNGTTLESPFTPTLFDGLDYAMLGDIHLTQVLGKRKNIAYPGSYPKQSYGESLSGGYFLWDIQSKKKHVLDFIEIAPVCPFQTLQISANQQKFSKNNNITSNARLRVVLDRFLDAVERKKLIEQLKESYTPVELKLIEPETADAALKALPKLADLRDSACQQNLLLSFLEPANLSTAQQEQLLSINAQCNREIAEDEVVRNVRYKIKHVQFDNLFSYGEANRLDLTRLRGLTGIFGPNGCGKSSLVPDIPMFALFNTISKDVQKNSEYVNDVKDHAFASIEVELNGSTYNISRTTTLKVVKGRETSNTEVKFTCTRDGAEEDLTGLERADTDKQIRKMFGTADDFMLTSVAPQFGLLGFLELKPTDRKRTVARYFDLEIFEQKHSVANDTLRGLKKQLAALDKIDTDSQIEKYQIQIEQFRQQRDKAETKAKLNRLLYEVAVENLSKIAVAQKASQDKEVSQLKTQYLTLLDAEKRAKNDLHELTKYTCLNNPGCCMLARKEEVEKHLAETQAERSKTVDAISALLATIKDNQIDQETRKKLAEQTRLRDMYARDEREEWKIVSFSERRIATLETEIEHFRAQNTQCASLKEQIKLYTHFTRAMSKDGISYQIIRQNLALLNAEVQKILAADTPFKVWLQDEDKNIEIYFQYGEHKPRVIELCSGMERTLAAISIRAALLSVTSLPTSNILVLDESFTALDTEYMDAVGRILHALKSRFDVIFVICHHDYVKDLCDNTIQVQRETGGYSSFRY